MKQQNAFTLIELLVVMGIMVLLMGISVMGFMGMRRGAELRGGAVAVRTTLMLARQQAVTKGRSVKVNFSPTNMIISFSTNSNVGLSLTNRIIYFTPGITITPPVNNPLEFKSTGGLAVAGPGTDEIKISEKSGVGTASKTIKVWMLTGATLETDN